MFIRALFGFENRRRHELALDVPLDLLDQEAAQVRTRFARPARLADLRHWLAPHLFRQPSRFHAQLVAAHARRPAALGAQQSVPAADEKRPLARLAIGEQAAATQANIQRSEE